MTRAASPHALRALVFHHCAAGVAAGLAFAALLLALNVGSLHSLLAQSPNLVPVFLIGAVIAFSPVVICTSALLVAGARSTLT
jgi:hypothetical protein